MRRNFGFWVKPITAVPGVCPRSQVADVPRRLAPYRSKALGRSVLALRAIGAPAFWSNSMFLLFYCPLITDYRLPLPLNPELGTPMSVSARRVVGRLGQAPG